MFDTLVDDQLAQMFWLSVEERSETQDVIHEFPQCVVFSGGMKQYCFRPKEKGLTDERLSGHYKRVLLLQVALDRCLQSDNLCGPNHGEKHT